jgi:O-antigen ligase
VFATISVLLSFYFFEKNKNTLFRVALCINALIQLAYIAFSDSRTGLVTLFITVFAYVYLIALRKVKKEKAVKYAICVVLALVIALSSAVVTLGIEKVGGELVVSHYEKMDDPAVEVPDLDGGRVQDIENDFSNRRFDIWKSGVEIFLKSPVTGVSYFNIKQFALEVVPETYLVNNDHGQFNNMHNMLFNLLAGQGILGMVLFIAFAIYAVIFVLKRIFKVDNEDYSYIVVMVVCVMAGFIASMFLTDIIYVNSPNSMVFWLFLGYIMHYLKRKDIEKKA